MRSPFEGRFTSKYDLNRVLDFGSGPVPSPHSGVDIAPPIPGTVGGVVSAAFAGTVERVVRGRAPGQSASVGVALATGRSGNGMIVRNPDGERQLYGHVDVDSRWRVDDAIAEGERIGVTDLSGKITGPHLHLETWHNASAASHFDPATLFAIHGVTIGAPPTSPAALMEDDMPLTQDDLRKIGAAVWAHRFSATSINESDIPSETAGVRIRAIRRHVVRQNRRAQETLALSRALTRTVTDIAEQTAGLSRSDIEARVTAAVQAALAAFDAEEERDAMSDRLPEGSEF